MLSGNARGAISFLKKAVDAAPRHADAYFELGNALLDQRDHVQAEASFLSALKIEPRRTLCYLNLGNLYSDTGDAQRAERDADEVAPLRVDGHALRAHDDRAVARVHDLHPELACFKAGRA